MGSMEGTCVILTLGESLAVWDILWRVFLTSFLLSFLKVS